MTAKAIYSLLLKKENAHDDPIYSCSWTNFNSSGDSKQTSKSYIVTGGLDCLVKIWTLDKNKLELCNTLKGHAMAVVCVSVSPNGHTIVSSSLDSVIILWDLISGNKMREIQTDAVDVWKVTFSPNGAQIASGGLTGKILLYGVENGTVEKVLDTRGKFALCVAWSSNFKYIASGSMDGSVCIFDVAQGRLLHTIEAHALAIRCVAFSLKSHLVASASKDGKVNIYDVESASLQSSFYHNCWTTAVCFSPDGTRVATAASDGKVRVALVEGFEVIHIFEEHNNTVWGVQFSLNSEKLLSVSKDKSINIYECPIPPKKASLKS